MIQLFQPPSKSIDNAETSARALELADVWSWSTAWASAARARDFYDQQAKERQKRKPANSVPVNLPEQTKADARDHVGKVFGVSGKSVDHATKVIKNAIPEVVKPVTTSTPSQTFQERSVNSSPV